MDYLPAREREDCSSRQKNREGRSRSGNLREQVVHPEMHPTPTIQCLKNNLGASQLKRNSLCLGSYVKLYPTPLSCERNYSVTGDSQSARCLSGIARRESLEVGETAGQLNPDWVEWLMGYPVGWTDPECSSPDRSFLGEEYLMNEPDISRITTRKDYRVSRLESLGNAIVPQVAFALFKAIDSIERF
ncbi:MAG: hypothetical protein ACK5JD_10830 [Mangrovibacterium sp.]